jgi:transcriptional regulator with XRE-family HTH domain
MNINIAKERKRLHFTQQELGEKLGLSKAYISMLESGRRKPSLSVYTEMMKLFDHPVPHIDSDAQ